jgi:REP element-mobilizing transposase RayT
LTYLLTFNCYRTRLPGDQRGWVDRTRGDHFGGYREPSVGLERYAREVMLHDPYLLDRQPAQLVLAAIREVCTFRSWELLAAHVRTNHVHCVVGDVTHPSRAIADFKAYASRALNAIEGNQKRWARAGSTHILADPHTIHAAVSYVVDGQDGAMAVYDGGAEDV